jgi:hypothetical protein
MTAVGQAKQARADKALGLKSVWEGPYEPEQVPAHLQPVNGKLLWLVDKDAGSMLAASERK